MSEYVWRDGNRVTITEFEARHIDEYGDCLDASHADTLEEATAFARGYVGSGAPAAVVEKHVSHRPAHRFAEPDVYEVVLVMGDGAALKAGGWV